MNILERYPDAVCWKSEENCFIHGLSASDRSLAIPLELEPDGYADAIRTETWAVYEMIRTTGEFINVMVYKFKDAGGNEFIYDGHTGQLTDFKGCRKGDSCLKGCGYSKTYVRYSQNVPAMMMRVHMLAGLIVDGDNYEKFALAGYFGNRLHCCHKDGNATNNRWDNLEFGLPSDNRKHNLMLNAAFEYFSDNVAFRKCVADTVSYPGTSGEDELHPVYKVSIPNDLLRTFIKYHKGGYSPENVFKFIVYANSYFANPGPFLEFIEV